MQLGSDLSAKETEEPRRRRQEDAQAKHTGEILRGGESRLTVPEAFSASLRSVPEDGAACCLTLAALSPPVEGVMAEVELSVPGRRRASQHSCRECALPWAVQ